MKLWMILIDLVIWESILAGQASASIHVLILVIWHLLLDIHWFIDTWYLILVIWYSFHVLTVTPIKYDCVKLNLKYFNEELQTNQICVPFKNTPNKKK